MTLDHFNNLSEDERASYLSSAEALETTIKDNEAEIASLKSEIDGFKTNTETLENELKEAKQLNFTLARKVDTNKPQPTFEDTLHDIFYKKGDK